ncbi:MAG: heparinase II/III family protein [Planctomycetota bacterium]
MRLRHAIRRVLELPPRQSARKALAFARRGLGHARRRRADLQAGTYAPIEEEPEGSLESYLSLPPLDSLRARRGEILALSEHALAHRFDLLGSGWVEVRHGMSCRGVAGHRHLAGPLPEPDPEGEWLGALLNRGNVGEARRIASLVGGEHRPIDWQIDFKSGHRWREASWHRQIDPFRGQGIDIKVPWELGRMQHLPGLVWALLLARAGAPGFRPPERYAREIENQIADFMAANPPRFGVQWVCPMDVAIRAAGWIVARDLLHAAGVHFSREWEACLRRGLRDHGRHILSHLEWDPEARGNHYLCDVTGLLFIGAALPRGREADGWLLIGARELLAETERQFTADGAHFESSSGYHRLAAETVLAGTALLLSLSPGRSALLELAGEPPPELLERIEARGLREHLGRVRPPSLPLPADHLERLRRMAAFSRALTAADGRVPLFGDHDSGRFLKVVPCTRRQAEDGAGESNRPMEEHRDHSHLVQGIEALLDGDPPPGSAASTPLSRALLAPLVGGAEEHARAITLEGDAGPRAIAYANFGVYILRTARLLLAVRCGPIGRGGNGGHAHNDQLSFVLVVDGEWIIDDPGTLLYTPSPAERNRARSTAWHSTLAVEGQEQNPLPGGFGGSFG